MLTIHMTTSRQLSTGLLPRAIDSVLRQEYGDFELIVCDDATEDGTAEYLAAVVARDRRVRIVRNLRSVKNIAISFGRCMQASDSGRRWVSWIFDDCVMLPGTLSRFDAVEKPWSGGMVYGVTELVMSPGEVRRFWQEEPSQLRHALEKCPALLPSCGIFVDRSVFTEVGWYDPSIALRYSRNWDLFRRIVTADTALVNLPDVVVQKYDSTHTDSTSIAAATLELALEFVRTREVAGLRLSLNNALSMPIDWIPPGEWSQETLGLMWYMFLEHFISVSDMHRAYRWARMLEPLIPGQSLLRQSVLRSAETARGDLRAMAAGVYSGLTLGAYEQHREAARR
jgi:glycosyltransferase involved in cell wall biosynthesis